MIVCCVNLDALQRESVAIISQIITVQNSASRVGRYKRTQCDVTLDVPYVNSCTGPKMIEIIHVVVHIDVNRKFFSRFKIIIETLADPRGVLVSVNFGFFSPSRFSYFHCNAMRKAIKAHENLHTNQQHEHTHGHLFVQIL